MIVIIFTSHLQSDLGLLYGSISRETQLTIIMFTDFCHRLLLQSIRTQRLQFSKVGNDCVISAIVQLHFISLLMTI